MNGFDIFIEVEGIEMREKFGDGLGIALLCGAQPLHEERSVLLGLCRLLCGCTDERAEGFFLVVFQAPPCDIAADLRDEFLCVCGFSLSGADAGEVGCVEIHGAGKLCVADAECGEQVFEVLNGAVKIGFFGVQGSAEGAENFALRKAGRIIAFGGDGADALCEPQKLFAVPAGFALAGAVAADGGIRYAGGGGKRFGGAAKCFDI